MCTAIKLQMTAVATDVTLANNPDLVQAAKTLLLTMDYFHRLNLGQNKAVLDEMHRLHYEEDEPAWITKVQDKAIIHTKALNFHSSSVLYAGRGSTNASDTTSTTGGYHDGSSRGYGRTRGRGGRGYGRTRGRGGYPPREKENDDRRKNAYEAAKEMKVGDLPPELKKALGINF
jgi:hypothetical protein